MVESHSAVPPAAVSVHSQRTPPPHAHLSAVARHHRQVCKGYLSRHRRTRCARAPPARTAPASGSSSSVARWPPPRCAAPPHRVAPHRRTPPLHPTAVLLAEGMTGPGLAWPGAALTGRGAGRAVLRGHLRLPRAARRNHGGILASSPPLRSSRHHCHCDHRVITAICEPRVITAICEPCVITAIASIASSLMCAARAKGRAAVCVGPSVHLLFSTAPVRPVP
jgi:hypothetical protein